MLSPGEPGREASVDPTTSRSYLHPTGGVTIPKRPDQADGCACRDASDGCLRAVPSIPVRHFEDIRFGVSDAQYGRTFCSGLHVSHLRRVQLPVLVPRWAELSRFARERGFDDRSSVRLMGRADRERHLAEDERRLAQTERERAEHHDKNEPVHFRAMRTHERSAELHDAIARLFPRDD